MQRQIRQGDPCAKGYDVITGCIIGSYYILTIAKVELEHIIASTTIEHIIAGTTN